MPSLHISGCRLSYAANKPISLRMPLVGQIYLRHAEDHFYTDLHVTKPRGTQARKGPSSATNLLALIIRPAAMSISSSPEEQGEIPGFLSPRDTWSDHDNSDFYNHCGCYYTAVQPVSGVWLEFPALGSPFQLGDPSADALWHDQASWTLQSATTRSSRTKSSPRWPASPILTPRSRWRYRATTRKETRRNWAPRLDPMFRPGKSRMRRRVWLRITTWS